MLGNEPLSDFFLYMSIGKFCYFMKQNQQRVALNEDLNLLRTIFTYYSVKLMNNDIYEVKPIILLDTSLTEPMKSGVTCCTESSVFLSNSNKLIQFRRHRHQPMRYSFVWGILTLFLKWSLSSFIWPRCCRVSCNSCSSLPICSLNENKVTTINTQALNMLGL